MMCNWAGANAGQLAVDIAKTYIGGGIGGIDWGNKSEDPGFGAVVGNGTEPLISTTTAQRLLVGFDGHEAEQLRTEAVELDQLGRLDTLGCIDLAADTIAAGGFSVAAGYLGCWDTTTSASALETCVLGETDLLIRRGILSRAQRSQVANCLGVLTGQP
ncbi:MAG: hypothetical protein HC897_07550 [Thermoanaerobaculia bacterium]|nr:hypothetical protein [Thermoanaerobaculia bacterium]